ncbi:uncharacterized protein LOC143882154 [Tasmannia lanceolata]|uniref:uncharacterized protein LOC143882154 n=1 Tax=Tasmannia lanceolata TaxID=3420 RepID=UPI004063969F
MGLSSKQVSGDGLDWTQNLLLQNGGLELPKPPQSKQQQQQQQQQSPPLRCPRCDSTNTKFCYYNNYNRSQPRHFCKACRRHWTKGGTLRNVPIGGGRKNKRLKTSSTTTTTTTTTTIIPSNTHMGIQTQQLPLTFADQKDISPSLYRSLLHPQLLQPQPSTQHHDFINNSFMASLPPVPQFPSLATISSSFNNDLSLETRSNLFNYPRNNAGNNFVFDSGKDTHFQFNTQLSPWTTPTGNNFLDTTMTGYWNWDDLPLFVSPDVKPPLDDPPQGN